MRTKLLLLIVAGLLSLTINGQSCNGITFSSPAAPANCTYTYSSSGWEDEFGNPSSAPASVSAGESVCILADNADTIGSTNFKGTFYVADGVTFSGDVVKFDSATLILEGTANFSINPDINQTDIFIHSNAMMEVPGQFKPNGSSNIHVNGILDVGGDLNVTGSAFVTIYEDSSVYIANGAQISNDLANCGLLQINAGEVHTGGGSGLINLCSTFIKEDFVLDGPFTNDGFLAVKGSLGFNGHALINDGILLVKNLIMNNDDIVGNGFTSVLIVELNAELTAGSSITGHYFWDDDDGGGFDVVCASCTEDIYLLKKVVIPALVSEMVENCGEILIPTSETPTALLDFDGVDDYLATDTFISGMNDISIMAWYRADAANAGTTTIAGEDRGCKLYLRNGNRPTFGITTQGNTLEIAATGVVAMNEWHHIAGTWSSSTGLIKLYVDGVLVNTNDTGVTGVAIETTALTQDAFAVGRTSRGGGLEYFDGAIDEVRVFDTVLTDDQIQRMVYQEIEEDMGNVHGSVIDKDVIDIATDTKVLWSDLMAYYPMTDIISLERTTDFSNNNRFTTLHNITSLQEQTAPMPYVSDTNGSWTTEGTWTHGDVWDIEDVANNKDWSIVRINSDVFTSASHTNLGLIVEDGKTFRVNGDNEINNSWYVELNGTMDLTNDSQLVQGINSDLVTGSNGKILRRQSGSSNLYWYTYMSSPVGATAATSLIDNNTTSNNPNNTDFVFNTLKEGNGSAVQFTNAHNEVGKISTRWMYTFLNGITYYDWAHFDGTTALEPGVGYIHKGTGNAGLDQEYLFEGKPNNGTILIAADDVDGDSGNESQADVTQTTTLIGNPYPSAIDAHKFINDNAGVIDGTLYLWHQWAGSSHILNEYEGGYAVINLMAKIRAYQFVGYSGANNGNQDGTLTPKQYIPVGQAFMTEVIADGDIEFNNSQRIFKREAVGESQYFRTEQGKGSVTKAKGDPMQIIKLEFTTSNDLTREIAIGFSDFTGEGFDYGYDGKMFAVNSEDMYTKWGKHKMVTQAFGSITPETAIPLVVNATGNYTYTIEATDFIDFDATQEVYLRDNYRNVYFDLRAGGGYAFKAKPDQKKRFEIVFKNESKPIKAEQALDSDTALIYFNTTSDKLYVKSLNQTTKRLTLTDMSGKTIHQFNDLSSHTLEDGLRITNISSGIYMVSLQTETNQILNKKIIID